MQSIILPDDVINHLEYFYSVFEFIKNGITLTDKDSKILYVNPAFTKITGYAREEAIGNNPGMLRSGYHDETFYKDIWFNIRNKSFWEGEIWNRNKSGLVYPSLLTITALKNSQGIACNYLAIFSDITFLESEETEKTNLAFYDPLTRLPNRLALVEQFNKYVAQDKRKNYNQKNKGITNSKMAVLFFDLNKFKPVNDTYGHVVGDKLLKEVAKRTSDSIRDSDIIARFGGDEFICVITDIKTETDVEKCCQRLQDAFALPYDIDGNQIEVGASIGISIYPDEGTAFDTLVSKADKAMYYAKKQGFPFYFNKNLKPL